MTNSKLFYSFLTLTLSVVFIALSLLFSATTTPVTSPVTSPVTIIIDAGHGGPDGGAVGVSGILEKDLNLDMAKKLQNFLTVAGYNVVMTRESDEDTDGSEIFNKSNDIKNRCAIADKYDNAIFVSIHMNASTSSRDKGFQVFYGSVHEDSKALAENIHKSISDNATVNRLRDVTHAPERVYITKNVKHPTILVECGFISNSADETLLKDESYRENLAFALYYGIDQYIKVPAATN